MVSPLEHSAMGKSGMISNNQDLKLTQCKLDIYDARIISDIGLSIMISNY